MNCEACQVQIGDFVDGTLDPPSEAHLLAHFATCPDCRSMADDFKAIRLTARRLDQPVPPERVWTKLAAALEFGRHERRRWWPFAFAPTWHMAAATCALLVVAGGITWTAWRDVIPPAALVSTEPARSTVDPDLLRSVETELKLAEEHYEKAIAGLEQITEAGRSTLDPQVAAVLEKNLSVIDQAIGESRDALRTQPASEVVFGALRSKVVLLQETITLINEMRKGNQEGAARIVSGLNQ
jgi:hypothetical protein